MSPVERSLIVRTIGELDQERLVALRERLGLKRQGRLGDAEDAHFGYRSLGDDPTASLDLWRTEDGWRFTVACRGPAPTPRTLAEIESEVTAAATDAGLTITDIRRRT